MNVLVYLVPLALLLGLFGLAAFLWALRSGQFDDLDGAGWRAISDDDLPEDRGEDYEHDCLKDARGVAPFPPPFGWSPSPVSFRWTRG